MRSFLSQRAMRKNVFHNQIGCISPASIEYRIITFIAIKPDEDIYDDAETVKDYVSNILSRVGSDSSAETGSSAKMAPSSLESAAVTSATAGMRTLWAEMKQVGNGLIKRIPKRMFLMLIT